MEYETNTLVHRSALSRAIWMLVGCLSLLLGGVGVVLPGLPTTPFVILAAFAFSKCSPTLHRWFTEHRVFGPMIEDWATRGAIAPRYKAIAVTMMGAALGLSYVMGFAPWVLGLQALAIAGAAGFILTRPSH